jgi:DNA helicase-2/ATP-dependent DNA helicase PcrA
MEYPFVFICGLNEGVFPSRRISSLEEMEEERRLAYVAMTRAMKRLYLSDAEGVANDGLVKYPSRFIFDIGDQHIDYVVPLDDALKSRWIKHLNADEAQLCNMTAQFVINDRVKHPVFGSGVILRVDDKNAYYAVKFDALPSERNIQFALLQKNG